VGDPGDESTHAAREAHGGARAPTDEPPGAGSSRAAGPAVAIDASTRRRFADFAADLLEREGRAVTYRFRFRAPIGFAYVSPSITALTGYTPEELCTAGAATLLLHPDDEAAVRERLTDPRGFDEPLVVRWVRKDGRAFRVAQQVIPEYEEGNLVAVDVFAVDVSRPADPSLGDASAALTENLRFFRRVLDAIPTPIFVYDRAGRSVLTNSANAALFGTTTDSFQGSTCSLPPEDEARLQALNAAVIDQGESRFLPEQPLVTDGGHTRWFQIRKVPIELPNGERAALGSAEDITERRELERRLVAADRLAAVGTLAAGVAHEINNPLAFTVANIEAAIESLPRPASHARDSLAAALEDALDGAQRIAAIVRHLRLFARPEAATKGPVDIRKVLDATIQIAWNEVRHRARLRREYDEIAPVLADEGRLGQVFLNLLVNAAQAIPEGAIDEHEISVTTRLEEASVIVEIRDTGFGIAPEVLPRIFDPFYTTKPVGVGTGLGLSICHGIVTSLGGDIRVESALGRGTTFRVRLPRSKAAEVEVATPRPSSAPATLPSRILVIDDEPQVGRAIARVLGKAGATVETRTGGEALDALDALEAFDVIFCDVMMPDVDGIAVFEAVARQRPEIARRFVFLTGGAFTSRARDFLDRVGRPVLRKPFSVDRLRAVVAEAIAKT
jgi:PAS domain S-box-containing protein